MKYFQVSFTRVGGQGIGDGWQTLNVSADTPSDVVASFSRFQNSNVYEPEFDVEDSVSKVAMELQVDTNNVFLTYIKYGLQDQTGRPTMFANSFVFAINDLVANPIDILRVKSNNFSFDIESTKQPLSDISLSDTFSLNEAIEAIGLNKYKYLRLMQCVFYTLDAKTKSTLHIISDCSEETIRKLIFCVYIAMPFAFRRKLTFCTYNSQASIQKTIIFDRKIKSNSDLYFDLRTGENNILTDAVSKKMERYEFITIAPNYFDVANEMQINRIFSIMEDVLIRFGNMHFASLDLNKLAYDTALYEIQDDYLQKLSDEALSRRLNELLSATVSQPAILDEQISCTLGEVMERGIILNDIVSEKLCACLENTTSEALLDTGNIYTAFKIMHMPTQEGSDFLYSSYKELDSKAFLQIRDILVTSAKGQAILKTLYIDIVAVKILLNEERILKFFTETNKLPFKTDITNTLIKLCNKYLREKINQVISPSLLMLEARTLLEKVFRSEPSIVISSIRNLQEAYWNEFSYEDLNLEMSKSYENIRLDGNQKSDVVFECLKIWQYADQEDIESFYAAIYKTFSNRPILRGFNYDEKLYISNDARRILIGKFVCNCLNITDGKESKITKLDMWLLLAELSEQNQVSFLIKKNILTTDILDSKSNRLWDILCKVIEQSTYLQIDQNKDRFVDELSEYIKDKETNYEIAFNLLKIIKEFEKQKKKEYSNAEKNRKKESGEDFLSKAKDFTSVIGDLFGKNKQH